LKNSDSEKKYDNLNVRKRELEEEKANIQRQMEKKDSEINDLNTKLNEKIAEVKSLQSDRKVFDEQLVNLRISLSISFVFVFRFSRKIINH
jgi:peptidoglycan hydrolase CwlO-like protein